MKKKKQFYDKNDPVNYINGLKSAVVQQHRKEERDGQDIYLSVFGNNNLDLKSPLVSGNNTVNLRSNSVARGQMKSTLKINTINQNDLVY